MNPDGEEVEWGDYLLFKKKGCNGVVYFYYKVSFSGGYKRKTTGGVGSTKSANLLILPWTTQSNAIVDLRLSDPDLITREVNLVTLRVTSCKH